MIIDHVIYAASDLEAATADLVARTGVEAAGGGRHEGMGTHNRILPLGPGYLEVLAVEDAELAAASPFGRLLQRRPDEHGDGLWAWAAAVGDVEAVADRLDVPLSRIARDGLTASLAGVERALSEPALPFFIARDPGVADPSAAGTAGGIRALEVAGDAGALRRWLGGADLPVTLSDGPPGVVAVGIGATTLRR